MTWHVAWKKDGMLRHPADGVAWKTMDAKYPNFSSENRNIRLGIASNGFNPFGTMSGSHSTWPVVVVNYNLPPWLNMKPENLIMSTLIAGPTDPVNSIDVYLQPLVEELKELWDVGVTTFDAATNQNFVLRASVLWIISDFPGYAMLSGWSTKGYLACPICNYKISSTYLKHSRKAPAVLSGRMIKRLLDDYQNTFIEVKGKRKDKKNIYDSILGTLLNISGKTKDHVNARLDLQEMGIRKILHPTTSNNGKYLEIMAANFVMTNKEKDIFCSFLENVKFPHGFASNISKYVQDRKVFGYKSHDAHIIMQYLLQIAVKKALKPEAAIPLIRLGDFFRGICSKSQPEGSIAEGYLADECVTFCARFPRDNEISSVNELGTRIHKTSEYPILSGRNQKGKAYQLSDDVWTAAHRYILFNYDDKDVDALIEQHRSLFDVNVKLNKYKRARTHTDEVCEWFKTEIGKKLNVSREITSLAIGPKRVARRFRGYVINRYRFHTKSRDKKCIIQNSDVYLTALTTSFASVKDQKPTTGEVTYYGSIEKIIEVDYWGCLNMVLFRCTWYADEKDHLSFTRVNFNRACQKKDPFVMSTQVHQVFYIEDHVKNHIYFPIKKLPTYFDDSHAENSPSEDDINGQFAHDRRFPVVENQDDEANWMGGDFMTFNLHHKGEFHKSKYARGTVKIVKDFELDVFSYSELMEWVNQLGYKEIGGIYVQKEENSDGWELITDDTASNEYTFKSGASELDLFIDCDVDKNMLAMRQMQPHVIVRPKRSPVNPKEDNPKKRQFVTLKDINEEKTRKMNKSRKKT
ncbi:uncharacterized protein LOC141686343 [Apium graveolens]|uniref:uncharacterized protein LOC141686343 n=1 Tax=Apium graveolens TaxID=4045 RepID=UPI003D7B3F79